VRKHLVGDGEPCLARDHAAGQGKQFLLLALQAPQQRGAKTLHRFAELGHARLGVQGRGLDQPQRGGHCIGGGLAQCVELGEQLFGGPVCTADRRNQEFVELAPMAALVKTLERIAGHLNLDRGQRFLIEEVRLQQFLKRLQAGLDTRLFDGQSYQRIGRS
jgi:hypothetical protein